MQKANGEVGCLTVNFLSDEFKDEARKLLLRKCLESLVHACQCRDANCHLSSCRKLKRVLQHSKNCKRQTVDGCQICKQFFTLCICHAKTCKTEKCPVAFCHKIKQKLDKQRMQKIEEERSKAPGDGAGSSSSDGANFHDAVGTRDTVYTTRSASLSGSSSAHSAADSAVKEKFIGSTDF